MWITQFTPGPFHILKSVAVASSYLPDWALSCPYTSPPTAAVHFYPMPQLFRSVDISWVNHALSFIHLIQDHPSLSLSSTSSARGTVYPSRFSTNAASSFMPYLTTQEFPLLSLNSTCRFLSCNPCHVLLQWFIYFPFSFSSPI